MIQDYHSKAKTAFALAAAWGFGLWSGISYTAQIAPTTYGPLQSPPAWVGTAETMAMRAVVVMVSATVVWIVIDWVYGGEEE